MFRFENLKIRTKLAIAFIAVLLPLVVSSIFTILIFSKEVKEEAESELMQTVTLLYRLCESMEEVEKNGDGRLGQRLQSVVAQAVRGVRVGKTGYAYVMDPSGNILVHPAREGQNVYDERDTSGVAFIRQICERAVRLEPGQVGVIRYPWMNPQLGDTHPRVKRLKYVYFRPWNWIIAAGSYESEIFKGVQQVRNLVLLILGITLTLILVQTLLLGQALTRPMHALNAVAQKIAGGDLSQQVPARRGDEIGSLAKNFNQMAEKLRQYTGNLERAVEERSLELAESERKYRTFVESSVDGLVTTDPKGHITFANHAMEQMLAEGRESLAGRHISEFYARGISEAREIMAQLEKQGHFRNREMVLLNRGREIPILTSASLLHNEAGEVVGTLGAFKDVSERKKLQSKLEKTQAQLLQTMKMRALGDLVAGVAHSINNPLMASNTMLHVMAEDTSENPVTPNRLSVIAECNRRIEAIVNHLKDFSRQSPGKFGTVDVNKTVEDALIISAQQLLNRNIRIVKTLAPSLPPVRGDANQLEEVIMELLANARDAMEESQKEKILHIATFLEREDGKEGVVIELKDSGKGIPPDIQDKIFEPFFSTKDIGKGAGLGLSICYGIVEQHGGHMEVESVPGESSLFRVRLPAAKEGASEGIPDATGSGGGRTSPVVA